MVLVVVTRYCLLIYDDATKLHLFTLEELEKPRFFQDFWLHQWNHSAAPKTDGQVEKETSMEDPSIHKTWGHLLKRNLNPSWWLLAPAQKWTVWDCNRALTVEKWVNNWISTWGDKHGTVDCNGKISTQYQNSHKVQICIYKTSGKIKAMSQQQNCYLPFNGRFSGSQGHPTTTEPPVLRQTPTCKYHCLKQDFWDQRYSTMIYNSLELHL